jgi:hypothetical protein
MKKSMKHKLKSSLCVQIIKARYSIHTHIYSTFVCLQSNPWKITELYNSESSHSLTPSLCMISSTLSFDSWITITKWCWNHPSCLSAPHKLLIKLHKMSQNHASCEFYMCEREKKWKTSLTLATRTSSEKKFKMAGVDGQC